MERRLAAILLADIVGYSRLIGLDEEGTIVRQKAHRGELIEPKISVFGGRIVKSTGDGLLAEFPSVVDAVKCAFDIQTEMAVRDSDMPEDRRIRYRIGINLGDIVIDGDDILGDGVNVAARLETLAKPGGMCISGAVYDQLAGKVDIAFDDDGEQKVKNISRPVRIWQWQGDQSGSAFQVIDTPLALPEKPSIAVLPFENMSGDAEQEYLADGITEDIISRLGRCRWLRVIARNSTFAYKRRAEDVRHIARELQARYILEGSVRRSGSRLRITAQLVDGQDGGQLWSEQYNRTLEDVFDLQDEITSVIAGTIGSALEIQGGGELRDRSTVDLGAWDCYQRALWHLYHFTTSELDAAKQLLERAIALDPDFAQAYARLAYVFIQFGWYGDAADRAEHIMQAAELARKAVLLDDRDPSARLSLGRALTLTGQIEQGIEELRTAVEIDPSFAQGHFALAQAYCYLDRHDKALPQINEALRLSPRDPHLWTFLHVSALARYQAGDLDGAELDARTAIRQPNRTHWPFLILLAAMGRRGNAKEAERAISDLHAIRPQYSCSDVRQELFFGRHRINTEQFEAQLIEDLSNAGLPE